MTGETGEYGGYRKGTRMKMAQKWLEKFGGPENERYGTNYQTAPFKVSDKCCYYLKEKPCDDWAREHNSYPYLGLMASEHGRREKSLMMNGCNYYGKSTTRSAPFAVFSRQDILQLALDLNTPIPEIYGTIERAEDGTLFTTKAQRTGCSMCGFGIHLEKRPHRFDRLRESSPKEWEFWLYSQGWGDVLSYVDIGWKETPGEVVETIVQQAVSDPSGTVKQRAARIIREVKKAKISLDYFISRLDAMEAVPLDILEEIKAKVNGAVSMKGNA